MQSQLLEPEKWKEANRILDFPVHHFGFQLNSMQFFSLCHLYSLHTIQGSESETKSRLILAIRQKMNEEIGSTY